MYLIQIKVWNQYLASVNEQFHADMRGVLIKDEEVSNLRYTDYMQDQLFVYYINDSKLWWLHHRIIHSVFFYSPSTNLLHFMSTALFTLLKDFVTSSVSVFKDNIFNFWCLAFAWNVLYFCNWTLDKFPETWKWSLCVIRTQNPSCLN